jgi:ABC-type Zn uptake system ZnuABC Zn-binding protein ZnuA
MNDRLFRAFVPLFLPGLVAVSGCSGHRDSTNSRTIGVTTSWLECAVGDIAGERFETVRLLPPGDCPGHFDLSPGTISKLSGCRLLFRFDFQEGLDRKLSGLASRGLRIVPVAMPGGLCVPGSYLEACRQVEGAFQETFPDSGGEFRSRIAAIEKRLSDLSSVVRDRIAGAGLRGRKVVSSEHQSSFCGWLGMEVVAEFCRAENMTSSAVEEVIAAAERSGARLVVANLQEGRRVADSIAQRLRAAVVVFSNFPSMDANQQRFDDLVLSNVESLIRGAKP